MFSPSAIADFLACRHLTVLNRAAAAGRIKKPQFADPMLELLIKLGQEHERKYLAALKAQELRVVEITQADSVLFDEVAREEAARRTVEAIRDGAEVIYQPVFLARDDERGVSLVEGAGEDACGPSSVEWFGRADFLRRVDKPSALKASSLNTLRLAI